jgi:tripartite-type tricarboxylate transporter receptor subunit TctC
MKTSQAATSICAAAFLFAAATGPAPGQSAYPNQQIKILCPFPAGGGTDLTSRLLGEQLSKTLGQPERQG